ncbi:MAG TPA: FAD-linked oxidase C-terminal domain-containing protein, partial [Acidisoma sp.]|nr:FAD-linked oxidase C-terminal domain-containing protein [Acidisoma sp.]
QMADRFPDLRAIAYGHVGDGNVHYNVLPQPELNEQIAHERYEECEAMLFDLVESMAGSISAEHGIGRTKRDAFLWSTAEVELSLMRGLKDLLDPQGILSPGRVL